MPDGPFENPHAYQVVTLLEAAFDGIREEARRLTVADFVDWPEALTTVREGYDESGWKFFGLYSTHDANVDALYDLGKNRQRCPFTSETCARLPGMTDAGFSAFLPGTHLWPHHGENQGILRCNLPLLVPSGDLGLKVEGQTRRWKAGECIVFDDTRLHEAWNHGAGWRVVLIVTFRPDTARRNIHP